MGLIIGVDTETTGLKWEDGDRVIELAMIAYDSMTEKEADRLVMRFNPQRAIHPDATKVHGILLEDLLFESVFADRAKEISEFLDRAEKIVIHNAEFDIPFMAVEMKAAGYDLPEVEVICTMEEGRWACDEGKLPKLSEVCWATGVFYDEAAAHAATYDVEVMMQAYFIGRNRGFYK